MAGRVGRRRVGEIESKAISASNLKLKLTEAELGNIISFTLKHPVFQLRALRRETNSAFF